MDPESNLTDYQRERIQFVADYIGKSTTDWFLVKRNIVNALDPPNRIYFSTRHPQTKKHTLNSFDKAVMQYWTELTGVELIVDSTKVHDPHYTLKPRGWALVNINKERAAEWKTERKKMSSC